MPIWQLPTGRKKDMASGNDMKMANESYSGFTTMVKWGAILSALAAAIVVLLIS
jgi:hypothetical protein